jgi:hypothetical protein
MGSSHFALSFAAALAAFFAAGSALADKVVVLPFTSPSAVTKPELDAARGWARDAVVKSGNALPSDAETASAEAAVKDGVPDTSEEYRAAGGASGSQWTLTARVERVDVPPAKAPDGRTFEGYTVYRTELEACQVATGRVESLVRDVDPDASEAPAEIAEMLALLIRPEGLANAEIPWANRPHARKVEAPPPAPQPPPPPPPPPPEPAEPVAKHAYAEGHPLAIGASIGVTNALRRPDVGRGPSWAMPIGGVVGYAFEKVPGLEARGVFTSQAIGPRALELSAGARYAIPVLPEHRVFIGPEILLGAHVALGAEKTARFLAHGSAFAAVGIGEQLQLEIAGDLASALGGSGTIILGGGTARALVRF